METWFVWSVIATVLGGLHVFINRVGSARGYNSNLLNSYSCLVSGSIGIGVTTINGEIGTLSLFMIVFSTVNGVAYLYGSNLRMDAMRHIDTTILLPLHKFVSPLFALLIGILFFKEILSLNEWWGIALGMLVPLLLISKQENKRQNNLTLGLMLMAASAAIAAVNAAINKGGVDIFSSVILFAAVSNFGSGVLGLLFRSIKQRRKYAAQEDKIDRRFITLAVICGIIQFASFNAFLFAFATGGALAVVYTIHSLYIVIPILLAIVFYNEHWNIRKALALITSIAAIYLMR